MALPLVFYKLSFFSDEVQIGPETVMTTLYTAKKYAVPALVQCFAALQFNGAADRGILYYGFFQR
jgi:BTB/POZ domain-containing protein 1/2